MRRYMRLRIGFWLGVLAVSAVAMGGAFYLGKLYLTIIREGSVSQSISVNSGSVQSVAAQSQQKMLLLTPVPVYFLQVGVFTDLKGAQDAVKPLVELRYKPYVTESAPYKIWIGVYKNRDDAEVVKKQLRDKGYGSFTGSVVVNGTNLRYSKGSEAFVKDVVPVLELYTDWLKQNLEVFDVSSIEALDWTKIDKQSSVASSVYKNLASRQVISNSQQINGYFLGLQGAAGDFALRLEALRKQRNQDNFAQLQNQLLRFTDKYLKLLQEIDNISKT